MNLRSPILAVALLSISLGAFTAAAGPLEPANSWCSPAVFNPTGVPFQMVQVAPVVSPSAGVGKDGLRVRYGILNTSQETLTRVGIAVVAFFPSGQVKGFHTFTMKVRIAPGERVFGTYASAGFHLATSDRLVMVPHSAAGATLRWVMGGDDFIAVNRSLEVAGGDSAAAGMVSVQEPAVGPPQNQNPSEPGASSSCLATCQAATVLCESTCKCGVSSDSCTCNPDGSLTTSCSCFQCPPPKP